MTAAARRLASRARGVWNRFWFAEVDALPWAAVRIGFCLAALQGWLGTVPLLRRYYSDEGEYPIQAARVWSTEYVARFLLPDALGSFEAVLLLSLLYLAALLALLVGYRTRVAAVASWLLTHWFFFRNPTFLNGGDEVLRLTSLYLAVGYLALPPADRAWSLDRLRARGSGPGGSAGTPGRPGDGAEGGGAPPGAPRMPAWPLRLLQVQVGVIYVVAGFWKILGPSWWDGTALWYAFGNSAFSRFGMPDWPWLVPFAAVATVSLAWWEFAFPVLVAVERTRRPALAYGVALHLGILVFMNIGTFPTAMLALYPAFLRGDELRSVVARLGRHRPRAWALASEPSLPSQPSRSAT